MDIPAAAIDWQYAQDTLRTEARRVTGLLRSVQRPDAPALGHWNVAEVGVHLAQAWAALPALSRRDLSALDATIPDRRGESLISAVNDLAAFTTRAVAADPVRDPAALADRIEASAAEWFDGCTRRCADDRNPWMVDGMTADLRTTTCHLLNETVLHGYDIARGDGRRWRIDPAAAALVLRGFLIPVISTLDPRAMVAPEAAGLHACVEFHVRGGHRFQFVLDDGALRVTQPSGRADCYIGADPAALLLLFFGRRSPWRSVASGGLIAWGRRPWLGPRLATLINNP